MKRNPNILGSNLSQDCLFLIGVTHHHSHPKSPASHLKECSFSFRQ